ncbi:MAG TPA: PilZ domain-containing protein, partial [Pyrinomonadaceae bacterium]|nr:PilZ domain-containing protein [Pyrinomonadaceae bacterium]
KTSTIRPAVFNLSSEETSMADDKDRGFETQEERRSHDRSRLIVDVFFDGKDVTGVASTKDISPGGLYMNTQADIPEGALLVVRIPFRQDVQAVCNAVVVYSNPGRGVGLRFQDLSDEVRAMLEREVSHG